MTTLILGFIDFAKVIPGFMDLPVSDQASLLKGNVINEVNALKCHFKNRHSLKIHPKIRICYLTKKTIYKIVLEFMRL
jgi:hypothetical protein